MLKISKQFGEIYIINYNGKTICSWHMTELWIDDFSRITIVSIMMNDKNLKWSNCV